MDREEVQHTLWTQDGVIARRQLLAAGARDHDVRRLLRRRELVVVHPGVYVDHTGPPTPQQLAQAAVHAAWPAALAGRSAFPGPAQAGPVEIVVARGRWIGALPGVAVRSMSHLEERVNWRAGPPRLFLEHAALQLASRAANEAEAFAVLAEACGTRRTDPRRLTAALASYARLPRGVGLSGLLTDLEAGACSVLERGYLTRVERAHGLPAAERQVREHAGGRTCLRDVYYRRFRLYVELDGRAFHDSPRQRNADLARDLAATVERGGLTVRLGYAQVFAEACATARQVAALMVRAGWTGEPRRCPACP